MSRDRVFLTVVAGLAGLLILFGLMTVLLSLANEGNVSEKVTFRVIAVFSGTMSGLLGLCSGYLIGRNGNKKEE